jgi:hypothetical protein
VTRTVTLTTLTPRTAPPTTITRPPSARANRTAGQCPAVLLGRECPVKKTAKQLQE